MIVYSNAPVICKHAAPLDKVESNKRNSEGNNFSIRVQASFMRLERSFELGYTFVYICSIHLNFSLN